MNKSRLEAFSDGVIAIIITIMVLEFKVPHGAEFSDLLPLWPIFLSYILSFANVGIYWSNHHHLMHATKKINGAVLLANLNLLFWLSLMPFCTAWVGENHFAATPVLLYCLDLTLCAISYYVLQTTIIRLEGKASVLHQAVGRDLKGRISLGTYLVACVLAYAGIPWLAGVLVAAVAGIWIIPDSRIEKKLAQE